MEQHTRIALAESIEV